MQVHCPECQSAIGIADDPTPESVECPSCSRRFVRSPEETISVNLGKVGETCVYVAERLAPAATPTTNSIGDYEVVEEVARGGMGVVYKARQRSLNRVVALKVILGGQFASEDQVRRFQTEAQAAARLDHPAIVPVYEVGQQDGQHFLSMLYVDGVSLLAKLSDGPLPPDEASRLIHMVAEAVQFAHDHDVVHRDLKPHNILLDSSGQPRITDFGLAKNVAEESGMTATGQVMGTPSYMPPEQALGLVSEVGPLSDVYSLGATLYHLLTGRPPFQAATVVETIRQVVDREPALPRALNPAVPRDLQTICLKCLRKDAGKRYESAIEFADDLRRWMKGEPIKARPVGRFERAWLWCRRRPAIAGSAVAILLTTLVLGFVGYAAYGRLQARAAVETLLTADTTTVLPAAERAAGYRYWSDSRLREILAADTSNPDDARRQLRARLALVQYDKSQAGTLLDALLAVGIDELGELGVIRAALHAERNSIVDECWSVFQDASRPASRRLRAGLALAGLAATSDRWTDDDERFLIEQLVTTNPVYQPDMWRLLRGVEHRLLPALESVFLDENQAAPQRIAAAHALAHFVPDDASRLARWLSQATPAQHEILYDKYARVANSASNAVLESVIAQEPGAELEVDSRLALGRQRAASAITLLRQDCHTAALEALRYRDDPEALTQFVHGCRPSGVAMSQLLKCFTEEDRRRGPLDGQRRKVDDSVMFALLLGLGEFDGEDLPPPREPLIDRLARIYALDPDSGVHGAAGWLLRKWGFEDKVAQVDRTPEPYDPTGHREWFVMEIDVSAGRPDDRQRREDPLYFTFIVLPPGDVTLGSPPNEPYRKPDEPRRDVTFTRRIAISDRELTWRQWTAMEGNGRRDAYMKTFGKQIGPRDPVFGVSWLDAIKYSRWLTARAGMTEQDQCYPEPESLGAGTPGAPWGGLVDPDRRGFRLPSEAEWERMCRAGTQTAFSFGNDPTWMERYAWYQGNAPEWSNAVASLRPNPLGIFDAHGNVFEWCHDWLASNPTSGTDPFGPPTGSMRVCRGGSAGVVAWDCRSSYRLRNVPTRRLSNLGFRLVLFPQASEDRDGAQP